MLTLLESVFKKLERFLKFKKLNQVLNANLGRFDVYDVLTGIAILAYGIVFSYFTVLKHYNFSSYAADLGVFDQAFSTTLFNGKLFYYTLELWINPSGCFFGVHFSPILFLLLPIYAVYPSVESLLVTQSFLLAIAAIPLYLISVKLLKSKSAGFVMVLVYLLYSPLHGANWFDFHPQIFIPLLIFFTFYLAIKKSWKLYLLSVLLTLMIQEHLVYIVLAFAVYVFFADRFASIAGSIKSFNVGNLLSIKDLKRGMARLIRGLSQMNSTSVSILTVIICLGWFLLTKEVKSFFPITPEFLDIYQAKGVYEVLGFKGDILFLPIYGVLNPQNIFNALAFDFHIKFLYVIILFGPLLFLSFRSKLSLLVLLVLLPMLLTNYVPYYTIGAQYPLYLIPLVFIATLDSLSTMLNSQPTRGMNNPIKVRSGTLRSLLKIMVLVSIIFTISTSPLSPLAYSLSGEGILWYPSPTHLRGEESFVKPLHQMIALVPSDASILTQNELFTHFSSRIDAYLIPFDIPAYHENGKESFMRNYTLKMINDSDYVLLNARSLDYWTNFVRTEISNDEFGIYALTYSYILFKRNYTGSPMFIPDGRYESFSAHEDLHLGSGKIIYDKSSNSQYVAFSKKGADDGIFLYGPYICLPPGTFSVSFEISVQEYEKGPIATFDVYDEQGNVVLARKHLYDLELNDDGWNNVTFSFNAHTLMSSVEFRIFTYGLANVYADRVFVETSTALDVKSQTFLAYRDLSCLAEIVNDESSKSGYVALSRKGAHDGIFIYGPYVDLPSGTFAVTFEVKAGEKTDGHIGNLEVSGEYGAYILCRRDIYGLELEANEWKNFTLLFTSTTPRTSVESRAFSSGSIDFYIDRVTVDRISSLAETDFGSTTLSFKDLSLVSGSISDEGIFVHEQNLVSGFFWSGPYMHLSPNSYKATFFLKISSLPEELNEKIITLEATTNSGIDVLASYDVYYSSFLIDNDISKWHGFTFEFNVGDNLENVEFRGKNPSPKCDIYFAFVLIESTN